MNRFPYLKLLLGWQRTKRTPDDFEDAIGDPYWYFNRYSETTTWAYGVYSVIKTAQSGTTDGSTNLTITQGDSGIVRIPIIKDTGYSDLITLSATGVPDGTTVTFSQTSTSGLDNIITDITISVGDSTPLGNYSVILTGSPTPRATISIPYTVIPAP